jgi:hypothetical protein
MDRRASTFSLLAKIAAWSVVFGIVLEDWHNFGIARRHHFPYLMREAVGGLIVAIAIALEIRFGSLEASAERNIRDWYAIRVAELDLARAEIEERMQPRRLSIEEQKAMADALRRFKGNTRPILVSLSAIDIESFRFMPADYCRLAVRWLGGVRRQREEQLAYRLPRVWNNNHAVSLGR